MRAGQGCSPGIGFYVLHPDGEERSLYDGLAFTCPVRDDQILEPGETDSVSFRWIPAATGSYHVRAVVLSNGPRSPSLPSLITVH